MSFHTARLIRGNLPSKPIESQAGYVQREAAYVIEVSRVNVWHEVLVPAGSVSRYRGRCGSQARQLQWWYAFGVGERDSSVAHGTARLEHWVVRVLSSFVPPGMEEGPTCIVVQMESLSKYVELRFWIFLAPPRVFPLYP